MILLGYDSPVLWREDLMKRFVEGVDRGQSTLFPDRLEDWIGDDNPVRVIDVFVDELGFDARDAHRRCNEIWARATSQDCDHC